MRSTAAVTWVQVQTDGRKSPQEAVDQGMADLLDEFTDIRRQFEVKPRTLDPLDPKPLWA